MSILSEPSEYVKTLFHLLLKETVVGPDKKEIDDGVLAELSNYACMDLFVMSFTRGVIGDTYYKNARFVFMTIYDKMARNLLEHLSGTCSVAVYRPSDGKSWGDKEFECLVTKRKKSMEKHLDDRVLKVTTKGIPVKNVVFISMATKTRNLNILSAITTALASPIPNIGGIIKGSTLEKSAKKWQKVSSFEELIDRAKKDVYRVNPLFARVVDTYLCDCPAGSCRKAYMDMLEYGHIPYNQFDLVELKKRTVLMVWAPDLHGVTKSRLSYSYISPEGKFGTSGSFPLVDGMTDGLLICNRKDILTKLSQSGMDGVRKVLEKMFLVMIYYVGPGIMVPENRDSTDPVLILAHTLRKNKISTQTSVFHDIFRKNLIKMIETRFAKIETVDLAVIISRVSKAIRAYYKARGIPKPVATETLSMLDRVARGEKIEEIDKVVYAPFTDYEKEKKSEFIVESMEIMEAMNTITWEGYFARRAEREAREKMKKEGKLEEFEETVKAKEETTRKVVQEMALLLLKDRYPIEVSPSYTSTQVPDSKSEEPSTTLADELD